MARNAKQILRKAIQDIEDGKWKKRRLIEDGPGAPTECIPADGKCDVYMGCALGLVAMHGGHGEVLKGGKWFLVKYPDETASPGVQKAVRALVAALPKQRQPKLGEAEDEFLEWDLLDTAVHRYNDLDGTTRRKALAWFKKALEFA